MERLQKRIATSGYCSRRKAEELIQKGLVEVNGEVITKLGTTVKPGDIITVEGNILDNSKAYEYYLLNKPKGVVTTTNDEKGRNTVIDLIETNTRIYRSDVSFCFAISSSSVPLSSCSITWTRSFSVSWRWS